METFIIIAVVMALVIGGFVYNFLRTKQTSTVPEVSVSSCCSKDLADSCFGPRYLPQRNMSVYPVAVSDTYPCASHRLTNNCSKQGYLPQGDIFLQAEVISDTSKSLAKSCFGKKYPQQRDVSLNSDPIHKKLWDELEKLSERFDTPEINWFGARGLQRIYDAVGLNDFVHWSSDNFEDIRRYPDILAYIAQRPYMSEKFMSINVTKVYQDFDFQKLLISVYPDGDGVTMNFPFLFEDYCEELVGMPNGGRDLLPEIKDIVLNDERFECVKATYWFGRFKQLIWMRGGKWPSSVTEKEKERVREYWKDPVDLRYM